MHFFGLLLVFNITIYYALLYMYPKLFDTKCSFGNVISIIMRSILDNAETNSRSNFWEYLLCIELLDEEIQEPQTKLIICYQSLFY